MAQVTGAGRHCRVLSGEDSLDAHIQDTLLAGAGLCDETATRFVVEHGRAAIDWLVEQGVLFTRDSTGDMDTT